MGIELADITSRCHRLLQSLPQGVTLIAATKYATAEMMRAAYAGGVRHFGENQVQSAKGKKEQLSDLSDVTWHMIGHLQTNKTRLAVQIFDWIHSVDRLSLAKHLDQVIPVLERSPNLCLQVRLVPDPQKSGWYPQELKRDLSVLEQLPNLKIRGLMTMLPLGTKGAEAQAIFQQTADLAQQLQSNFPELQELSMGMSQDYTEAIAAGATMIRVGSSLFL